MCQRVAADARSFISLSARILWSKWGSTDHGAIDIGSETPLGTLASWRGGNSLRAGIRVTFLFCEVFPQTCGADAKGVSRDSGLTLEVFAFPHPGNVPAFAHFVFMATLGLVYFLGKVSSS